LYRIRLSLRYFFRRIDENNFTHLSIPDFLPQNLRKLLE